MRVILFSLAIVLSGAALAEDYPCKSQWETIGFRHVPNEELGIYFYNPDVEKYRRAIANTRWVAKMPGLEARYMYSSDGCSCSTDGGPDHIVHLRKLDDGQISYDGCDAGDVSFCMNVQSWTLANCSANPDITQTYTGGAPLREEDFR
jgi:hypothetical protein